MIRSVVSISRCFLLLGCAAGGCATQSRAAAPMLGYTDHKLFVIEHHDPAHGGRIVGTVCAVDLQLEVRQQRDGVVVAGNVTDRHNATEGLHWVKGVMVPTASPSELPFYVEVRDRSQRWGRVRELSGAIGDMASMPDPRMTSSHTIDLQLTRDALWGQLGARHFELEARGDDYVGRLTINGVAMPFVVRGREQMWSMPAAAQGSILPLLFTCSEPSKLIQIVDLRQTDQPPASVPAWMGLHDATAPNAAPIASPAPMPSPTAPSEQLPQRAPSEARVSSRG